MLPVLWRHDFLVTKTVRSFTDIKERILLLFRKASVLYCCGQRGIIEFEGRATAFVKATVIPLLANGTLNQHGQVFNVIESMEYLALTNMSPSDTGLMSTPTFCTIPF